MKTLLALVLLGLSTTATAIPIAYDDTRVIIGYQQVTHWMPLPSTPVVDKG